MAKKIILCCDGTNNQMTGHETNVLRLYRSLVRGADQLTFYDPGVGTLADPMAVSKTRKMVERSLDAAIGRSLCQNFSDAYRFLSLNYEPGDQVYLFGFSRGAYTARSVAGAVHMFGLLRPELVHLAPYVWAIYANDGGAYTVRSRFGGAGRFHDLFGLSVGPQIRLLGLWDTVSSFGWFWSFQSLPYTANNPSVDLVRHALSIDERRVAFAANLFYAAGVPIATKRIKQVWFPGVHSDVGGGYPDNEDQISKITFDWMIKELQALGELRLDQSVVDAILGADGKHSKPDFKGQIHKSLTGFWNIMEWLPRRGWQKLEQEGAEGERSGDISGSGTGKASSKHPLWVKRWMMPHLYRRRPIPPGAWVHPAVRERQAHRGYKPNLPATAIDIAYVPGQGYLPKVEYVVVDDLDLDIEARIDGVAVGSVGCARDGERLKLADIKVDERVRQCGIGSGLLRLLLDAATKAGIREVYGIVTKDDLKNWPGLLAWYEGHGFAISDPEDVATGIVAKQIVWRRSLD